MLINGKTYTPKRYSSGEMKLLHSDMKQYINESNIVDIIYYNEKVSLFELILIIRYYNSINCKVDLTLAYFPYQRMDHGEGNEIHTLKFVVDELKSLKLNSITLCDPHFKVEEYFENAKVVSFVDAIFNKIKSQIKFNKDKDVLFFTDAGSLRRFGYLSKNCVYCKKIRDKQTGLIASYEVCGDIPNDSRIVIIDDIISTGDTLRKAIAEIQKINNNPINIICGHFEKNKFNKQLIDCEIIEGIYSSSSLTKKGNDKLKIFSVKDLINFYKKV